MFGGERQFKGISNRRGVALLPMEVEPITIMMGYGLMMLSEEWARTMTAQIMEKSKVSPTAAAGSLSARALT